MTNQQQENQPAVDETSTPEPSMSEEERIEDKIDRDLADSFPASDPPGWTMGVTPRSPQKDEACA